MSNLFNHRDITLQIDLFAALLELKVLSRKDFFAITALMMRTQLWAVKNANSV